MKKTVLAVAFAALAVTSTASAEWYVQGDLGYSKSKVDTRGTDQKDSGFEPRISLGYKFQDFRLALDYTHYHRLKDSYNYTGVAGNTSTKIRGAGLSAIYDIPVQSALQPYVGVRLAVNNIKLNDNYVTLTGTGSAEYSETSLGYGAIVGVSYPLAPNWKLNVGAEYNRLGSVENADVNNYGVKAGLRYEF